MDQIIGLERNVYLSVIVPAYNAESYLEQCISSIKGQSYSDIQIILVDDGSTDHWVLSVINMRNRTRGLK